MFQKERARISILIPCYNEEVVLGKLYDRLAAVVKEIKGYDFEFVLVNDGSTDGTLDIMKELRQRDDRVSYVDLSRNFGKEAAMMAGIDYVSGDAAIIMDADLQDSPELIPEMIGWWEKGYDDVSARRRNRAGESFFKKCSSYAFYRILQKLSDIPIQPDVGDFRLLDRQCLNALRMLRESQRYTKGMFSWIGFRKKEIFFDRPPRAAGKSKWNYWKLLNLAIEGITSFTIAPLRIASLMGCLLSIAAMIYMLFVVVRTLIWGNPVAGYPSLIAVILFIGGVQLLFMGIMGEYLGRIFNESKGRPLYLVKACNGEKILEQRRWRKDE